MRSGALSLRVAVRTVTPLSSRSTESTPSPCRTTAPLLAARRMRYSSNFSLLTVYATAESRLTIRSTPS
jgi:hypothetical protein